MLSIKLNNGDKQDFETLTEAIKYLNRALYYCFDLYLLEPFTKEPINYSGMNESDVEEMFDDIQNYNFDFLEAVQVYE